MDDDSVIAAARFIKQSAPTPAPAPQPVLQSYSVQKGASSRSFVRYVDLVLNNVNAATNLISSIASSAPRIRLTNKGHSGTSNSPVSLQGFAKSNGTSVNIDFGTKGLGGSPTTSTADGSYLLEMDLDANGSYETSMRFHRLLGDVNGDKVVDGEIGAARLFATIYKALGINPQKNYYVGSRPVPLTDPGTEPVKEVLA